MAPDLPAHAFVSCFKTAAAYSLAGCDCEAQSAQKLSRCEYLFHLVSLYRNLARGVITSWTPKWSFSLTCGGTLCDDDDDAAQFLMYDLFKSGIMWYEAKSMNRTRG